VPFYDPNFGDVGQIMDPMVYAGFLATVIRRMTIGTAGIILPLRDPLLVAKQATSVDQTARGPLFARIGRRKSTRRISSLRRALRGSRGTLS